MADEFERIERLKRKLGGDAPFVRLSVGDDAALLENLERPCLSVDCMVEQVHFRRAWLDMDTLARRAMATALSDLAAMGASPRACLCAWVLPADLDDAQFEGLVRGTAGAARDYDAPVVGGNLSAGAALSLTTTVVGQGAERPLLRAGARVGDGLYVTGTVGAAALGLELLLRDEPQRGASFVERWRRPSPRLQQGRVLSGPSGASAAIDLSDGLLQDLGHLCQASGVGARVLYEELPLQADHGSVAQQLGLDGRLLALTGGEDYELLFTAPGDEPPAGIQATRIGSIVAASEGVGVWSRAGQRMPMATGGHRHFDD